MCVKEGEKREGGERERPEERETDIDRSGKSVSTYLLILGIITHVIVTVYSCFHSIHVHICTCQSNSVMCGRVELPQCLCHVGIE